MKKLQLLVLVFGLVLTGCSTYSPEVEQHAFEIAELVRIIQHSVRQARDDLNSENLDIKLETATLTLKTEVKKIKGGSVKLVVFSGGASRSKTSSNTITIELIPLDDKSRSTSKSLTNLNKDLVLAIESAVLGASKAKEGDYPLDLKKLTVEVGFVVTQKGDAKIGITMDSIEAGIGGDASKSNTHSIKLVFLKK